MTSLEIKANIIRNVLDISDMNFLKKIENLVMAKEKIYAVSNTEHQFLEKSRNEIVSGDYISHNELFTDINEWLKEK